MIPGVVRAAPGCGGLHASLKSLHAVRGGHFRSWFFLGLDALWKLFRNRLGFWRRFGTSVALCYKLQR